jgi:hypothetical protein
MKKLLLILLCVPLIFSCGENKVKNEVLGNENKNKNIITDLLEMNLKGKVKSIISLSSDSTRFYFNKFGNITKIIMKKEGDNYVFKYHFDNNQKISQYFYTEEDGIIDSVLTFTFKYNNGYLIEKIEKTPGNDFWGEQKVTKYEYDNDGNEIKSSTYNSDRVLSQERISEWNDVGQKIKSELYSISYISTSEEDLNLIYTWTYTYNDNGHEKSIDFKGWKREQSKTDFYDYEIDINGNWTKRTNQGISKILYYGEDNPAAIPDTSISYEERIINYIE